MLEWRWFSLVVLDIDIRAVEATEEAGEEDMEKAAVQAAAEAEEEV